MLPASVSEDGKICTLFLGLRLETLCAVQVTVSALELVAPRHSWSADALRLVSPSAAITSGPSTLEATVVAPEIYWASSAAATGKAEAARPLRRQMWQGGDLAMGANMGHARIHVRQSRNDWRILAA